MYTQTNLSQVKFCNLSWVRCGIATPLWATGSPDLWQFPAISHGEDGLACDLTIRAKVKKLHNHEERGRRNAERRRDRY